MHQLGLIEWDEILNAWSIPRWSDRQYESDDVTKRTAKHRSQERVRNVPTPFPGTTKEHTRDRDRDRLKNTDLKEVKTSFAEQGKCDEPEKHAEDLANSASALGAKKPENSEPSTRRNSKPDELMTAIGFDSNPKTRTRKRDPLFDAVALACSHDLNPLTKSEGTAIGSAAAELRPLRATPEEVWEKDRLYTKIHPLWDLTPRALVKHWSELTRERLDEKLKADNRTEGIDFLNRMVAQKQAEKVAASSAKSDSATGSTLAIHDESPSIAVSGPETVAHGEFPAIPSIDPASDRATEATQLNHYRTTTAALPTANANHGSPDAGSSDSSSSSHKFRTRSTSQRLKSSYRGQSQR